MRMLRIPIVNDKGQYLFDSDINLDQVLSNTINHHPATKHYSFKVGKGLVRTTFNPVLFEEIYEERLKEVK